MKSNNKKPWIAPSLLSADFACLDREVASVEAGGADWIHFDIMDGHFVPNLTFGAEVVKALRSKSKLLFDCHLMVSRPEEWIDAFADAGADLITVHVESTHHLHRLIQKIKARGCKAGVSLNPATPVGQLAEVLALVDLVLVMSVNPGFGGQSFIESSLEKIKMLAQIRAQNQYTFWIEVDGGIQAETAKKVVAAGADVLVAGSAVFKQPDRKTAITKLR